MRRLVACLLLIIVAFAADWYVIKLKTTTAWYVYNACLSARIGVTDVDWLKCHNMAVGVAEKQGL